VVPEFDIGGALRRIRRRADLSQREMAEVSGISQSSLSKAEAGRRGLTVDLLVRCAALAGLRLALIDENGTEVPTMAADGVRDRAARRFPAHLDTRYGDEDWWHGPERYSREQPWYTFDRLRHTRDHWRAVTGTPQDHRVPQPGDSPADRRAARARAASRRREEEGERRLMSGGHAGRPAPFTCTCLARCDELDDRSGPPVHAEECPCSCDLA
jgi:transcriptional regulator with XRE-family HTH domain